MSKVRNVWRIAARQSDLARLQAYRVGEALNRVSGDQVEYSFRSSLGDQNQLDPLWKMPEKGVFTQDFVADLEAGQADLVVHSWKDLPTEERVSTEIVATLPRADARDVLLFRRDRLPAQLVNARLNSVRILTSSPRREYNLALFLREHLPFDIGELSFLNVRGNILTRLEKLMSQDVEGLVVAKAALDRLLEAPEPEFETVQKRIREILASVRFMVLPLSRNPTAAAQGALAVEVLKASKESRAQELRQWLAQINCEKTFRTVERERTILRSYGGGCHQKIGVTCLERDYGALIHCRGLADSGEKLDTLQLTPTQEWLRDNSDSRGQTDLIYPRAGEEQQFFAREDIETKVWQAQMPNEPHDLWVARETGWPKDSAALTDFDRCVVWTAGLETWRKLAKRGVWVSGAAEGLGETEDAAIRQLLGREPKWLRLTHADAAIEASRSGRAAVGTYRLIGKAHGYPNLKGRRYFFWMSGTQFDRAVSLMPEILEGVHFAGPGATLRHVQERVGAQRAVHVCLDVRDFWARFGHGKSSQDDRKV